MAGGKLDAGIIEYAGANTPGWVSNLGISLSSGTLTIVDSGGATLTQANPGWVTAPSTTAGIFQTIKVTTAASFNDDAHASSDLTNLGFGITETAHWANDMPFFLYVVNRGNADLDGTDGNSAFFLARDPRMYTTPSAGDDIGDTDALPVNDTQDVILLLGSYTQGNYTSLPCQLIGAIRMQWSTTTDDWTIQTLDNGDGIGQVQLKKTFSRQWSFPQGQNGASSGTYLLPNGGTAPTFSTTVYDYQLFETGHMFITVRFEGDGGTAGAGAVTTQVAMPYVPSMTDIAQNGPVTAIALINNSTNATQFNAFEISDTAAWFQLRENGASLMQNADFGAGSRFIRGTMHYRAY